MRAADQSLIEKEFKVENGDEENGLRYGFSEDCRMDWLVAFLKGEAGSRKFS